MASKYYILTKFLCSFIFHDFTIGKRSERSFIYFSAREKIFNHPACCSNVLFLAN